MFIMEQLLFLVVLSHLILPPLAAVIFTRVVVLLLQYLVAPKVVLYARCFFFHSFLNPRPLPALFAGYTAVQGSELSNTNDGSGAMTSPAYSYLRTNLNVNNRGLFCRRKQRRQSLHETGGPDGGGRS